MTRPSGSPHVALSVGRGAHVFAGTAVLLLPRRNELSSPTRWLLELAASLVPGHPVRWHALHCLHELREQIRGSRSVSGRPRRRCSGCCFCLFFDADSTARWLRAVSSIDSSLSSICRCRMWGLFCLGQFPSVAAGPSCFRLRRGPGLESLRGMRAAAPRSPSPDELESSSRRSWSRSGARLFGDLLLVLWCCPSASR